MRDFVPDEKSECDGGISAFLNRRVGKKDPVRAKDDLYGNALVKK